MLFKSRGKMSLGRSDSLLWELSLPGREESSYLFGTIHLQEMSLFFRVPDVKECIKRTDAFMAEFPLDEITSGETNAYNLPDGQSWTNYVSLRHYRKMEKIFMKSFSININLFNRLLPMVMEQVILETMIRENSGQTMDFLLWSYARMCGKTLIGAESKDSQLYILRNFPKDAQFKNLKGIARNPAVYRKKVQDAKHAYFDQDIKKLADQSIKTLGKMKRILVYDRNVRIADAILQTMQNQTLTCAVGAGHLHGLKGVLRMLKKKGVLLKPVLSSSSD